MKNTHILFVINPKSGGSDKSGLDKLIKTSCEARGQAYSLHFTTGKHDERLIRQALLGSNATIVVACGGDGTINLVAKCILNSNVSLGIIPLGSANGLANEFDIPADEIESLHIILTEKPKPLDVVRINDEHISLHLSDVGFNANMIKEFERDERRGKLGYAKAFFKSILNRESAEYTIIADEWEWKVEAEMLVFANASSYGTGAIINPDSTLNDGLFELIAFKPIPLTELPSLTFESFFGNIKVSPFVETRQVKTAKIHCNNPQLLQVDGELVNQVDDIHLSILPNAIQLIRP